ncbi:hypothetical protein TNCV_5135471 [Trichonephila clavipes]|nr:hypothetical protein TNCV_5135471 [Trichonephila clavipes]
MVVGAKTEGAGCRPVFLANQKLLEEGEIGPPRVFKETVRKVTGTSCGEGRPVKEVEGQPHQRLDFCDKREKPVIGCVVAKTEIWAIFSPAISSRAAKDRYHNNDANFLLKFVNKIIFNQSCITPLTKQELSKLAGHDATVCMNLIEV